MRIMGRLFGYILRRYKLHCLGVLLFILAIMVLGVVCWQWGARFHQRYEEYVLKQR